MQEVTKQHIIEVAARCMEQWEAHFDKFYNQPLPGDAQKRAYIRMGVESLRDELLRELILSAGIGE